MRLMWADHFITFIWHRGSSQPTDTRRESTPQSWFGVDAEANRASQFALSKHAVLLERGGGSIACFVRIARCVAAATLLAGIVGCADERTISPNDPAYNASGAPGNLTGVFSTGPRPYEPLGTDSP